jgi:8-oxo-dGTP pyrophosphatase MutT (NUDIX family)
MARLLYGERIGRTASLKVGCSAIIFDESREKVLLQKRTDNGRWCMPGGGMDPGESTAECCVREVKEETGLDVEVVRLVGVYTTPHHIVTYADGNRWQLVSMHFEARITGGRMEITDGESTEMAFIAIDELANYDVMEHHLPRIEDTLADKSETFVR